MIEKIKEIRVNLDGATQSVQNLDKSREVALAITALQLSKMWLGKVLKELGNANPYPESKNPESSKIEPTADVFPKAWSSSMPYDNQIANVKALRAAIEKTELEMNVLSRKGFGMETGYAYTHLHHSFKYCIEAGMWLGMELGRIRDSESKEKTTK